jgi:glycosyltransferase domain-containing protein
MEKNLTILVLLKGREEFTERFVEFFINSKLKYKLFFADGDKKRISKKILNKLKKSNVDFQYHKFEHDINYKRFINKIYQSLKLIKTKYVMLFDNDDFPQKYSINKCLLKLEKSTDIIGCGGYLINFNLFSLKNKKNYLSGNAVNLSKINLGSNFNNQNSIKRLSFFLTKKKNINTVNDIIKTNILKKNYKILKNLKFDYIFFYFLLADIFNYYSGKIYKIKMPFIIHQHHSDGLSIKMKSIYETLEDQNYLKQKKIVYKIIRQEFKNEKIINLLDKYFAQIDRKSVIYKKKFKRLNKNNQINILNKTVEFIKFFYQILKNKYLNHNNIHTKTFVNSFKNKKLQIEILQTLNFIKNYEKI